MAHYAKIENGLVTGVIVADQGYIDQRPESEVWVQTSYNTVGGIHYSTEVTATILGMKVVDDDVVIIRNPDINDPDILTTATIIDYVPDDKPPLRGNFAAIGDVYDPVNDVFYPPSPFPSWVISSSTNWKWVPPVEPRSPNIWRVWHETSKSWLYPVTDDDNDLDDFVKWVEASVVEPESLANNTIPGEFLILNHWSLTVAMIKTTATNTASSYIISKLENSVYPPVQWFIQDLKSNFDVFYGQFHYELSVLSTATEILQIMEMIDDEGI